MTSLAVHPYRPLLVTLVPEGALVREAVETLAPALRASIVAVVEPQTTDTTLEGYAEGYRERAAALPSCDERAVERLLLADGREAVLQLRTWEPEGRDRLAQLQLHTLVSNRGCTATATTKESNLSEVEEALRAILAGIGFAGSVVTLAPLDGGQLDASDRALDAFERGDLAVRFDAPDDLTRPQAECYSVDELAAIADIAGAGTFPGLGAGPFVGLDPAARAAVMRASRRSLLARGVLEVSSSSGARFSSGQEALLRCALAPSLLVQARRRTQTDARHHGWYANRSSAVRHVVRADGVHVLEPIDAESLGDEVLGFASLGGIPQGAAGGIALTTVETLAGVESAVMSGSPITTELGADAQPFLDALGGFRGWVTIGTLRNAGGRFEGGQVEFVETDAGLWQVERKGSARDSQVELRPSASAEIAATVAEYLGHAR